MGNSCWQINSYAVHSYQLYRICHSSGPQHPLTPHHSSKNSHSLPRPLLPLHQHCLRPILRQLHPIHSSWPLRPRFPILPLKHNHPQLPPKLGHLRILASRQWRPNILPIPTTNSNYQIHPPRKHRLKISIPQLNRLCL
jgi:hypothetical protein